MGSNISTTPTSVIQSTLGGLKVDNQYGPKTTDAVKQFQTANNLKVDGIFGPITQAAFNTKYPDANKPASSLITTSGSARSTFDQNSNELNAALGKYSITPGTTDSSKTTDTSGKSTVEKPEILSDTTSGTSADPFIQQLDAMGARSDAATQMLVNNIKTVKATQSRAVDTQYNNYKSGLQALGIQTNAATVTPDLLMSHINQAESEHQDKINTLNNEEIKALTDAQTAKDNNDFKTLNEKMTYLKQIRTEKTTALKNYQDALTTEQKNQKTQGDANAKLVAPDIYTTLQTLDPKDQEQFLVAVSEKLNIPITSLVPALVAAQTAAEKATAKNSGATLLTPTEAKTLGVPYGTTRAEAAKMGITPKTATKTKTESQTAKDKAEIETGKNVLKTGVMPDGTKIGNPKGEDGFYDPGVYTKLFSAWKGTPKDFVAKYPIVGSINPESYGKLPAALKELLPKTKTKTGGRSASGK